MGVGYIVHFFSGNTDLRYMGGGSRYTFALAVLLLGVSLNLSGLPYSAGFLGKEFLIFQFFGTEFISYFIRACWLVSFFCTPLYMGLLLWLSLFTMRRGFFNIYSMPVRSNYFLGMVGWNESLSPVVGRFSLIVLSLFWFIPFCLGEYLFLLVYNYSTVSAIMGGGSFTTLHSYAIWGSSMTYTLATLFPMTLYVTLGIGFLTWLLLKVNVSTFYWGYMRFSFFIFLLMVASLQALPTGFVLFACAFVIFLNE